MAQIRQRMRRRPGRVDAGAAWISYSDMMAALLLVFVLVLCYSIYQYFLMLETKTTELDEKEALLTTQELQLVAQQDRLVSQQTTLSEQQEILSRQQAELTTKQNELTSALTSLENQKGLLDSQSLTLEEQQRIILAAQAALQEKEDALSVAQTELADRELKLTAATSLLTQQQSALDNQQARLDDLVGVRTEIIHALRSAFAEKNLRASVDANTGDIMLESAVFFDFGKDTIKAEGQRLLDAFIPVYLSVLLRPEYVDYLGEIVIEGHTDSSGEYLSNLALSQERALSVATYCLQMTSIGESQLAKLRDILTAKGRSYSDLIYVNGVEDATASRRVEFKFRLKDSEMIDEIRGILAD